MERNIPRFLIILTFFSIFSCKTRVKYGEITHKTESDSLKSIAFVSSLKKLDITPFKKFEIENGEKPIHYRFLKPINISNKKYPLIVVFHGAGAIGSDNEKQIGALSKIWLSPENRTKYPAYIFSPQFPDRSANYRFDKNLNVPVSYSNEYLGLVTKQIDQLIKSERIDPKRIYLIGFSMGAATVMNAISERPDLFAAAVNISGISRFDKIEQIKNIPIWIVHGKLDTDNKIESDLKFFEKFKNKGKIAFWEWDDKYHTNIMSEELVKELPKWLFKQRKK